MSKLMYARVFKDAFKYSVSIANDKKKPLIVSRISTAYVFRKELLQGVQLSQQLYYSPLSVSTLDRPTEDPRYKPP